jgi:iron complex transport system ATP-binding protein
VSEVLRAKALSIGYASHVVARDLELDLGEGCLVCLLGPNGAGKSTLLRTLCAMQRPLAGEVLLRGQDIHRIPSAQLARLLAVVLTERVSAGLLSAYEIVCLGRYPYTGWSGKLSDADHHVVRESIEQVGAEELAPRPFQELSDGERQKVMLARALAQQPSLMILDEVTAFLDLPRRVEAMRILKKLARERKATILLSTHDLDLALRAADRIWLLEKGGAFRQGLPEELVLDGSFANAFRSEGIEFDGEAGQFLLEDRRAAIASLRVDGEGVHAVWTRRALERSGFRIDPQAALRVRAEQIHESGTNWIFEGPDGPVVHSHLQSLLDSLNKHAGQTR